MAQITASLVKELREKTGGGMMDCKKALQETDGDLEAAVDWLRKKGLAAAAKKAGRTAAEGLVGVATEGSEGAIVELNSETDFVARNDRFQALVNEITAIARAKDGDLQTVLGADFPGTGRTVEEELTNAIATIGENMSLRRTAALKVENGVVSSYVHNAVAPGLGKIGVLVALESTGDAAKLDQLGRQVAMHVAAANPQSVSPADMDQDIVERERSVLREQALASGKPAEIVEKMIEGRIRKFYQEVVLLEQTYVIDPDNTVGKALKAAEADVGAPIAVTAFIRFALGEGIEREESDFAAEVAAATAS
ncbi:MAG: translation elongation factor Ts [Rhizobiales bacterium NRL2]|jgi:elongation factor Ts|nr:MAG: translation elongation factor Ts [Rhizobiales bacterium NRL2]